MFDVVVIGGGAAGLMVAATAGARGRRVVVLEHTSAVGAKILISGGGRCNFTNREVGPQNFLSENPDFARSALARYTPDDFIARVDRAGIAWYEKTLGQLFCEGAGAAAKIVRLLLDDCAAGGVEIHTSAHVIDAIASDGVWRIETQAGAFAASALVIATGGLSIPKIGATGFAFDLAARFGLPVEPPRPGLAPFTFTPEDRARFAELAGVSTPVRARATRGPAFAEALLFTHRGLSGPALLQASSYWRPGEPVAVDFTGGGALGAELTRLKRERPKVEARTALAMLLPKRLADLVAADWPQRPLADWRDADLRDAAAELGSFTFVPAGSEGWAKAEVTAGGVSTAALSSKTMEAKAVRGLYFVGEAVDVTGWLGGYNFQWAWSSGWAAGQAV
ncbi:MAG: NAD(P)/FAD-dependent oxidoreductase [Caulobacterales bacterium]